MVKKQKEMAVAGIERIDAEKSASRQDPTDVNLLCAWAHQPEGGIFWHNVFQATKQATSIKTGVVAGEIYPVRAMPKFIEMGCQRIKWSRLEKLLALKGKDYTERINLNSYISVESFDSKTCRVEYKGYHRYKISWKKIEKIFSFKEKSQALPSL